MSEYDYTPDYDQIYQQADYVAQQNAQRELGDAQVAEALLVNSMLIERTRQETEAQFAVQQANEAEERLRAAIPAWPDVDAAEKALILQRAHRNGAGKPFSMVGFVDEVVDAVEELRREQAKAAEREQKQSDLAFQEELVKNHTDRTYSNRRSASWVHETLRPDAEA